MGMISLFSLSFDSVAPFWDSLSASGVRCFCSSKLPTEIGLTWSCSAMGSPFVSSLGSLSSAASFYACLDDSFAIEAATDDRILFCFLLSVGPSFLSSSPLSASPLSLSSYESTDFSVFCSPASSPALPLRISTKSLTSASFFSRSSRAAFCSSVSLMMKPERRLSLFLLSGRVAGVGAL